MHSLLHDLEGDAHFLQRLLLDLTNKVGYLCFFMLGTFQLNQSVFYLFLYRLSARPCALYHEGLNKHLNQERYRQFISEQISQDFIDLHFES